MTVHVYRYKLLGFDLGRVNKLIAQGLPASVVGVAPRPLVDLQADDSVKPDLDVAMAELGWTFDAEDPTVSPPRGPFTKEVKEIRLNSDSSTTNTSYTDLLTINITTEAGFLEVYATISATVLLAIGSARLTLDGNPMVQGGCGLILGTANGAIIKRAPVAPGAHTVALQWRATPTGTVQIRPATQPNFEHATLLVRETN